MRHDDVLRSPGSVSLDAAVHSDPQRWSTLDYLQAMAVTAALIAPVPFFWNPPFWVLAFMTRPTTSRGSAKRASRSPPTRAANDNTLLREPDRRSVA